MFDRTPLRQPGHVRFLLWPTRSMTWAEAQRVVFGFGLVAAAVGLAFAVAGFPLILPFCGLEFGALWLAFYHTFRAAEERQTVTFTPEEIVVEKGRRRPETTVAFQRPWVRIALERSGRLHPRRLMLGASGRRIEVGEFLSEDERGELARALISESSQSR